jgi:multidrug efflux pump subunit AcrA (membrane-fusion protein)
MQLTETTFKEIIMIKYLVIFIYVSVSLLAIEIPVKLAKIRSFGASVTLNAKVIQLSNAQQSVTSLLSGHLEKYFVGPGEKVESGQKLALIESIHVSKMTAEYIALKKQYDALMENYEAVKKLYEKGMTSMQELNNHSIMKNEMLSRITTLKSQLKTLGINAEELQVATANYILYAHDSGTVSELLQPLHAVVGKDSAIISIVKERALYVESYLPLEYASRIKAGQKITVDYAGKCIVTHITQVMPKIDETTQRIVVLSSVDEKEERLFINAYVQATLYFDSLRQYVSVEKTAISFFNGEWVVFVPREEEGEHAAKEEDHALHDEHETAYGVRVIEIVAHDERYFAVKGLQEGEEYVSAKSYFVKSLLLKSSLGGHGH